MLRTISFALSLAAAGVLGLAASLLLAGSALAGTISGTSVVFNPDIRVPLAGYTDWAVWNTSSLTANLEAQTNLINNTLTRIDTEERPLSSNIAAAIYNTGAGYYTGGLSYTSTPNLDGKGFSLTIPDANDTTLDLWFLANGPVTIFVEAVSGGVSSTPITLNPYNSYKVSFTSSGLDAPLTVHMSNVGEYSSAQGGMSFGAAGIVAVPEPEYWLAVALLVGGYLAYQAVSFVIWVRSVLTELDDERQDFQSRKRV